MTHNQTITKQRIGFVVLVLGELAELLLKHGSSVNRRGGTGHETALQRCLQFSNTEVIKQLFKHSNKPNPNKQDAFGNNALHWALKLHDVYIWKHLLSLGADVNMRNTQDESPLEMAYSCKNTIALKAMEAHDVELPKKVEQALPEIET